MLGVSDLYNPQDPWAHYITNALKAKELFVKDVNYIVRDGEAVIVDEFTGRVMPGRRWSDGQHQAIEAKEALPIQPETRLASIAPEFLSAVSTLGWHDRHSQTEEVEFEKTHKRHYDGSTNQYVLGRIGPIRSWTEAAKWRAVANETAEIHKVLAGVGGHYLAEKSEPPSRCCRTGDSLPSSMPSQRMERELRSPCAGRAGAGPTPTWR